MKINKFLLAILATAGLVTGNSVFADPGNGTGTPNNAPVDGDLFLGFVIPGTGPGTTNDYLVDIGQANQYYTTVNSTHSAAYSGPTITIGNFKTDLDATFGAVNWPGVVQFGVFGLTDPGANANVFVTTPNLAASAPYSSFTLADTGRLASVYNGITSTYSQDSSITTVQNSANQTVSTQYAWGDKANAYPANFGANQFNPGLTGGTSSVNLAEIIATNASASAPNPAGSRIVVGQFTLASDGTVTFGAPVPEPTTFAAIASGAAMLGLTFRRRNFKA